MNSIYVWMCVRVLVVAPDGGRQCCRCIGAVSSLMSHTLSHSASTPKNTTRKQNSARVPLGLSTCGRTSPAADRSGGRHVLRWRSTLFNRLSPQRVDTLARTPIPPFYADTLLNTRRPIFRQREKARAHRALRSSNFGRNVGNPQL